MKGQAACMIARAAADDIKGFLLAVLCAAVNTTLRRFAADQLEDGDNTLAALTDTFGADWVQNLPKVSPSNNRDEGAQHCARGALLT